MKTTPAIDKYYSLWMEACKVRTPDDTRQFLRMNETDMCAGLEEACRLGIAQLGSSWLVHLLDSSKALVHRSLLVRRQLREPIALTENDMVVAFSDPALVDSFFASANDIAICYIYTARDGQTWAIVLAKGKGEEKIRAGQRELVSSVDGPRFLKLLRQYFLSVRRAQPDFVLQAEILSMLGAQLIPFLAGCGASGALYLIPHSILNVLPIHSTAGSLEGRATYLDELFRSIGYSTCLPDLIMAAEVSQLALPSFDVARVLAVLDLQASDLPWLGEELENWKIMKFQGLQVDIASTFDTVPSSLGDYSLITLSGHAHSDPGNWGRSYIAIASDVVTAAEIAQNWHLSSGPVVTLAACETALDSGDLGFVDEYSGLDLALRVAGARAVYATLWPVSDPIAALAAMVLPLWLIGHRANPGQALTTFQRSLREGRWTEFLPTDGQLSRAHPWVRERYGRMCDKLRTLPTQSFRDTSAWAAFRCCGV